MHPSLKNDFAIKMRRLLEQPDCPAEALVCADPAFSPRGRSKCADLLRASHARAQVVAWPPALS
jgi:hypothetical protein